jgi:transposase
MLAPLVRRTYAPRGKTPIQEAWHRKGRISAISAVTVSPVRRRPNLFFRLLSDNTNAHGEDTVAFLAQLRGRIKGPMTILWDQSRVHERSGVVRAYLAKHLEVVAEDFPGYAPDANPDEGVWGYTKYHRLPNYASEDTTELRFRLWDELSALRQRPDLLASFIRHAGVPLRL